MAPAHHAQPPRVAGPRPRAGRDLHAGGRLGRDQHARGPGAAGPIAPPPVRRLTMAPTLTVYTDPAALLDVAGDFLEAREDENAFLLVFIGRLAAEPPA